LADPTVRLDNVKIKCLVPRPSSLYVTLLTDGYLGSHFSGHQKVSTVLCNPLHQATGMCLFNILQCIDLLVGNNHETKMFPWQQIHMQQ
jgi:hypothetical protein